MNKNLRINRKSMSEFRIKSTIYPYHRIHIAPEAEIIEISWNWLDLFHSTNKRNNPNKTKIVIERSINL